MQLEACHLTGVHPAMNSFDLFGTLIAGAACDTPDGDQEHHFTIAENIAKVQPGDIVISDYYDQAKALRLLRDVAGLSNKLIVTEDGKASGRIWQTIRPDSHLGDNPHRDVDSPRRAGISANSVLPPAPIESVPDGESRASSR